MKCITHIGSSLAIYQIDTTMFPHHRYCTVPVSLLKVWNDEGVMLDYGGNCYWFDVEYISGSFQGRLVSCKASENSHLIGVINRQSFDKHSRCQAVKHVKLNVC